MVVLQMRFSVVIIAFACHCVRLRSFVKDCQIRFDI